MTDLEWKYNPEYGWSGHVAVEAFGFLLIATDSKCGVYGRGISSSRFFAYCESVEDGKNKIFRWLKREGYIDKYMPIPALCEECWTRHEPGKNLLCTQ